LLEVVEWQVNELRVRVLIDDLSYASSISCPPLQNFDFGKLTISLEQAASDEAIGGDKLDAETRIGNVDNEQEEDKGKENE